MSPKPPANKVILSCQSTNDIAKTLGEMNYPHGTWISSQRQTRGRGRFARKWISRSGNLFLSMLVRIEDKRLWTWLPLVSALSCARAIKTVPGGLAVLVKWPNDLFYAASKLGGILCEGVISAKNSFVVIGIGINCNICPKLENTTAIAKETGRKISVVSLRNKILKALLLDISTLSKCGPEAFRAEYERTSAFKSGTKIRFGKKKARVIGLGASGELLVRQDDGTVTALTAEEALRRI